ncbi:PTS mannitol transporter subunit IICBA [Marinococcus halophilus]|uniref:PTS system mannitol-specific EIICB component n=1 Tax=Marinococcus halophilus TaxID=1371 RepID=A0A510Y2G7_MARHA|nr:PTS mannitol-specific transporter subunit IIBC [Marinococcus halophilus]OZT81569.1 PTS mannitol transporter subunit IICBA [Marinococcus halophilus]GEK57512.1 PTS mannitol transporter subunit IICB [Marinococcus halophilus]
MSASTESAPQKKSIRSRIQKFGSFLSSMIMPNIGAFIAWGLITAFFIESGWTPNENLAVLVDPMIVYMLPLLIGYTGGKIVHDVRGGVVGAVATIGVIAGADIPMFLGAMAMGPLGGITIKGFDKLVEGKIRQGFEMLVNNFSAGIIGFGLSILGLLAVSPIVQGLTTILNGAVDFLINTGLLPLTSIIIEPAKVLFLNNAINHGVLSPIAAEQVASTGKSILYLLEPNPGPGLGILLAFAIFGAGVSKASAPGAIIIQFFGGIHEIYFPYVLSKPLTILAVIAGGMTGVFTFSLFNVGLTSVPSPGSIFLVAGFAAPGDLVGVLSGVFLSALVSFVVASIILKFSSNTGETLEESTAKMESMKGKKSSAASALHSNAETAEASEAGTGAYLNKDVNKIVFACDAGMGSSAMGASVMKDKVKKAGLDIGVTNTSISNIPDDADLIITHKDLTERARQKRPDAEHVSVENFLGSDKYDEVVEDLKQKKGVEESSSAGAATAKAPVNKIIFACDAGMGSSAMGASVMKDKVKKAGLDISVSNTSISNIPDDADLIITHKDLTERARQKRPDAEHVSVENFLGSDKYDEVVEDLKTRE